MAPPPAKKRKTATAAGSSRSNAPAEPHDRLYNAASAKGNLDRIWTVEDFIGLGITADQVQMMGLLEQLMMKQLLQPVDAGQASGPAFRLRQRDAARKYEGLDSEAAEVYRHIENAGASGMWKLTIKRRTGIHENKVEKILRNLCGSKHIKQLKNARNNAKKTYLLFDLEPAKEVTGGAWFSDGDLDSEFIELVATMTVHYVKAQSWIPGPRLPNVKNVPRVKAKDKPVSSAGVKEEHEVLTAEEAEAELRRRVATDKKNKILLPQPPGYAEYPTAREILDKILASGFVHDKDLTINDMHDLFARLVFDGRLELMGRSGSGSGSRNGQTSNTSRKRKRPVTVDDGEASEDEDNEEDEPQYRWVRRPDAYNPVDGANETDLTRLGPGNGFSEVPCSRCPVAKLCREGGPVEAKSCEYFAEWF